MRCTFIKVCNQILVSSGINTYTLLVKREDVLLRINTFMLNIKLRCFTRNRYIYVKHNDVLSGIDTFV